LVIKLTFLDAQDGDVIGMIDNKDLNCVTVTVSETGKLSLQYRRYHTGKVIKVETDTTASYDLTLFFTDSEANQLSGNDLSVISKRQRDR
jgi:hypothetical protein